MSRCLWAIWLTGCYASWSSPPGSDPGSDGGSFEPDSVCGSDDASVHVVEPFQSPELFVVGIYAPSNDQRWPEADWGRRGLAVVAEELTGHPLSAFVGCAEGAVFRFGRD